MASTMSPAGRRYVARFAAWMSLYVVGVLGAPFVLERLAPGPLQVAVAVAPALCIVGVIWAVGRYLVEERDEYVRLRLAQAILVATGVTLSLCTVWGFLEEARVLPHLAAYDVFPVFCAAWGLGQLARRLLEARRDAQ